MNKSENPSPSHTFIAFILDRSGSMNVMQEAAIAGFNEFLRDQQAAPGVARLSLVQFDDQYEIHADNLPISEIVELTTATYQPRGSTALLDAVGKTIDDTQARIEKLAAAQRPEHVVFAIFTDGLENSSLNYSWQDIAKRIRDRREKDGWEFLFLAANQDAVATAAQMSIDRGSSSSVAYSHAGIYSSSRSFSRKIRSSREWREMQKLGAPPSAKPQDVDKPMEDIVREEEEKEQGGEV